MSRRDGIDLASKIDEYKALKDEESAVKKSIKPLGDYIKKTLLEKGATEASSNDYTAKISITPNEDFNELQAIEILKQKLSAEDLKSVVKTKEYIDDDALESLVYLGKFDIAELAVCKTPKEPTVKLTISKKK